MILESGFSLAPLGGRGCSRPPPNMQIRTDTGFLKKPRRTAQGFLRVGAYLTRTGVLHYRREDGTVQRELRHPDEVFSAASLESLTGAPVTDLHPSELVTEKNAKDLSRGYLISDVKTDGKRLVQGDVVITDPDLIAAVESGARREVSPGYTAQVEMQSGEYGGEPYDAIQRNIVYNHVGIGPRGWGRSGSEVSLHLDGGQDDLIGMIRHKVLAEKIDVEKLAESCEIDSYRLDSALYGFCSPDFDLSPIARALNLPHKTMTIKKIRIDSQDIEVSEASERVVTELFARVQARADGADKALATAEAKIAELSNPARIEAAVTQRLAVIDKARKVIGSEFRADGKTDLEVKFEVAKAAGFDVDGKSEAYVQAAFDIAEAPNRQVTSIKTDAAEVVKPAAPTVATKFDIAGRINSARRA